MTRGVFLSFEGIDGSGKSTQARRLAAHLRNAGREVVLTREPGGSPGAEEIRQLLLDGAPERWSAETELLLFTAARRDHVERVIRPALDRGAVVVSDRFIDSTRVYQGTTRGDLRHLVDLLHDEVIGLDPDRTFLIDIPPERGLDRALGRDAGEERFENFGLDMARRMRAGFLDLARADPARIIVIDGGASEDAVAVSVLEALP